MELNDAEAGAYAEVLVKMANKIEREIKIPEEQESMIIKLLKEILHEEPQIEEEEYMKTVVYAETLKSIADKILRDMQLSDEQKILIVKASREVLLEIEAIEPVEFGGKKNGGNSIIAYRLIDEER